MCDVDVRRCEMRMSVFVEAYICERLCARLRVRAAARMQESRQRACSRRVDCVVQLYLRIWFLVNGVAHV